MMALFRYWRWLVSGAVLVLLVAAWLGRHGLPAAVRAAALGTAPPSPAVLTPTNHVAAGAISLVGRVLDSQGKPSLARVKLVPTDSLAATASAAADTNAAGVFELRELRGGEYWLWAWADSGEQARAKLVLVGAEERVELRLSASGAPLTGVVRDAAGGVVVGAEITATTSAGEAVGTLAFASSDQAGRYRLRLPAGSYFVTAAMQGYASERGVVRVGEDGGQHDFQLLPAGKLSGIVRAGAEVAANATVRVVPTSLASGAGSREATTDAAGAFELEGVQPGGYVVRAMRAGAVAETPPLELAAGETKAGIELVLAAGRVLSGVVRTPDGRGVAGVEIRVQQGSSGVAHTAFATSDAAGSFSIGGLFPELTSLLVDHQGYLQQSLALGVLTASRSLDLTLAPAAELRGVVRNSAGELVPDARVWATAEAGALGGVGAAKTSARGEFALRVPADRAEASYRLQASHDRFGLGSESAVKVGVVVTVALRAGSFVAGQVLDSRGAEVPFARILASSLEPAQAGNEAFAVADGSGRFRVGPLPNGRTVVRVQSPSGPSATSGGSGAPADQALVSIADRDTDGVELRIAARDARLEGRVVDEHGQPVDGALVLGATERFGVGNRGEGSPVLSDQSGAFVVEGLAAGPCSLFVELSGYAPARVHAVAPGRAEVRLLRPGGLRGVVKDASGGAVGQASITVSSGEARGPDGAAARVLATDAQGGFAVDGLDPGAYDVQSVSPDGRARAQQRVEVNAGQLTELQVRLAVGGSLTGRVVAFESDQPLAGLSITVATEQGRVTGTSSANGSFTLLGVVASPGSTLEVDGASVLPEELPLPAAQGASELDVGTLRLVSRAALLRPPAAEFSLDVTLEQALVADVVPGSPAASAGLSAGMRISMVQGKPSAGLGRTGLYALLEAGSPFTVQGPSGGTRQLRLGEVVAAP